jgi:phi13 family phage major tail protein
MANNALKGLRAARLWPITTNDADTYATGTMVDLPGAQALTKEVSKSEFTIYADDGVYDSGSDFQYEDLTLTLAELTPELESKLSGGTYDATDKKYTFKTTDSAPEFALGYAALKLDGKYRMFKHFVVKLLSVKIDHQSKGDGNDIQAYQLTFRGAQRKADNKIRETQDSATADYTWLDTIEQFPIV